jgi:hypothetical protein
MVWVWWMGLCELSMSVLMDGDYFDRLGMNDGVRCGGDNGLRNAGEMGNG